LRILSDPPLKWKDKRSGGEYLVSALFEVVRETRHKALLISPYFVPGDEGVAALAALVRERDAHVGVITNSLAANDVIAVHGRSEEHTSELQSRENLVCRLLLEKKKN